MLRRTLMESAHSMLSLRLTSCGNPSCPTVLEKAMQCAKCRARSYCGRSCQRADWPTHRDYCSPKSQLSDDANTIRAYDRKHHNAFIMLALEFLLFHRNFSHLKGSDCLQFLHISKTHYLHVTLRRIDRPPRGRHNRLAFVTARLNRIDDLPDIHRNDILRRLEQRFPAVCLGFSVYNPLNPSEVRVTTITHSFPWPSPRVKGLGILKAARLIWMWEWVLVREAEAKAERRGGRK